MPHLEVWKFPLTTEDEQKIHPPKGWEFLCIQNVREVPVVYMLVNPLMPRDSVVLITKGTGHPIEYKEIGDYLSTYQLEKGMLVFHVFRNWSPE